MKQLFDVIEQFTLKHGEKWELHSGDIVINKKKWKQIKKEFSK